MSFKENLIEALKPLFRECHDSMTKAISMCKDEKEKKLLQANLNKLNGDLFKKAEKEIEEIDLKDISDEDLDDILTNREEYNPSEEALVSLHRLIDVEELMTGTDWHHIPSDSIVTDQKIEDFKESLRQQPY
jgi:hypothetical protein